MKKTKRLFSLILSLVILTTTLASCTTPAGREEENKATNETQQEVSTGDSTSGGETTAQGGKILRFSQTVEPPTLDPQLANSVVVQTVASHMFETLFRVNGEELENAACESYEVSDDGLVYTFKLRDGLVWSDGQPVVAEDYAYGFGRLVDPAVASPFSFFGLVMKNASKVESGELPVEELGVRAIDEKTLEVELEYPAIYFVQMLAGCNYAPTRKDYVEKYGTDFANSADKNVYSGPFVLSEWRKNDRVILTKNANYWNASEVKLDGVEVLTVQDANTALAMFESGDLDYANIPVALASEYPDADFFFDGSNDYLLLNHKDPLLSNHNLRMALNYGISRKAYITLATRDVYVANQRFVLPQVSAVDDTYGNEYPYEAFPLEGDMEKAKEYLNLALEELNLSSPSDIVIELLTSDAETARTEAEVIQAQYKENLGITINIRQVAYKQRIEMQTKREFQMCAAGWVPDYSDPYSYLELWLSYGPNNNMNYSNPEYDAALEKSVTETDPKKRMDLLFEAEKILLEDGGLVGLQLRRIPYLKNPKLINMNHYFVGLQHNFVYADFTE